MNLPPHQHFRRIFTCAVLLVTLIALLGTAESADVDTCYAHFSELFQQVKSAVGERYGNNPKLDQFKPEVADELSWLTSSARQFSEDKEKLKSRRSAFERDKRDLEAKENWLSTRQRTLDGKKEDLEKRAQQLSKEGEKHNEWAARHNANRCMAPPDNPGACTAYDAEAVRINEEKDQLTARQAALAREESDLENQQGGLSQEAASLQSISNGLDQTQATLSDDETEFIKRCEGAAVRARALLEVIKSNDSLKAPSNQSENGSHDDKIVGSMVQGFGVGAVEHLFDALKTPILKDVAKLAGAELAGPVLSLLDATEEDMDDRATEIARNTYLLGDYATALKRLKADGRLNPGDEGYEALRQMTSQLGNEMPGSNGEFTWQSLTQTKTALKNAMKALVTQYAPVNSGRAAKAIMKEVTPESRKIIGKKGLAVFNGALETVIKEGATKIITEPVFTTTADAVSQQHQKAAEQALKRK